MLYFMQYIYAWEVIIEEDLYKGTAKGAEGYAVEVAFSLAKNDNIHIDVHRQDADSSSLKLLRQHYTNELKNSYNALWWLCSS